MATVKSEDILYSVHGSSLTAIADAIRAKKDTTAIFSLDQMAVEIEGIVTGNDLPNAEDAFFGTSDTSEREYAIENYSPSSYSSYVSGAYGGAFTVKSTFAVVGFHMKKISYCNPTIQLWDITEGKLIASAASASGEILLASPVNLTAGKTYAVVEYGSSNRPYHGTTTALTFNEKIAFAGSIQNPGATADSVPTVGSAKTWYCGVNLIMAQAITETVTTERKIQTATLDDIADEVKRITGASGTLSPAQIITALQGIAVQTTE